MPAIDPEQGRDRPAIKRDGTKQRSVDMAVQWAHGYGSPSLCVLLPRHQVDITIVSFFRRGARADFKIERGFSALIDEMMPIGLACGKACSHPRRKGLLPGVGDVASPPLAEHRST